MPGSPPFDPGAGPGYVWHCHIIDHEDNEMMRPYTGKRSAENILKSESPSVAATEKIDGVVLEQKYPNPVDGVTQIKFTLPEPATVQLKLYNSSGEEVQTILDAAAPAGQNIVRLNVGNLKSGLYFYQLKTGFVTLEKKMIIR